MKTIVLTLNERQERALEQWSRLKDMEPEKLLLHAFTVADTIWHRQLEGETIRFQDANGQLIKEPVYGCMGDE